MSITLGAEVFETRCDPVPRRSGPNQNGLTSLIEENTTGNVSANVNITGGG